MYFLCALCVLTRAGEEIADARGRHSPHHVTEVHATHHHHTGFFFGGGGHKEPITGKLGLDTTGVRTKHHTASWMIAGRLENVFLEGEDRAYLRRRRPTQHPPCSAPGPVPDHITNHPNHDRVEHSIRTLELLAPPWVSAWHDRGDFAQ